MAIPEAKTRKRSHQFLCFQREHEKGCSRQIAFYAISFSISPGSHCRLGELITTEPEPP